MDSVQQRIVELKMQGFCCAQMILVLVGLEPQGKENADLVQSIRGLCYGMYAQHTCGVLSGGVCALALYDFDQETLRKVCAELVDWFDAHFGGVNCVDLLGPGGQPAWICNDALLQTTEKCLEILQEHDFI
ncbi:putative redox-active protein [Pelotomaculum schinkii]|uniref:Putative redox-active protein n=1 Tax=Pelotomaculum schinkii TaxID=78350 RepID=A0A4Y7RIC8_9FIRM|nr:MULTISPECIES: C-GCAxxG-C-C family protein [Pelotomaculum]TEB08563.1 putative redox-active protein [Pelotomaculum schinkii]TEB17046.1 putative redox-active protein [Pelotomaculum sp. FP]